MESSASPSGSSPFTPFILGGVRVDPGLNAVSCGSTIVTLEPQVMRLLLFLSDNVDATCSRENIMSSVWPESEPNEEALTQAISKLRKALGDADRSIVTTVRKVGYRLNGPVTRDNAIEGEGEDIEAASRTDSLVTDDSPPANEDRAASGSLRRALTPRHWIWKAAAVVLVGFAISRFKVVAVHHDGVDGPRMVAVRMMDDGTMIRSHTITIDADSLDGQTMSWTAKKSIVLPADATVLPELPLHIMEFEIERDGEESD